MKKNVRILIPLVLAFIIYVSSLILPFWVRVTDRGNGVWRGYVTLFVADTIPREDIDDLLTGIPDIISPSTTFVGYSDFTTIEKHPLDSVSTRLDPRDPRYDSYMKSLPGLFVANGSQVWNVWYIKKSRAWEPVVSRIQAAFKGKNISWSVDTDDSISVLWGLFAFIAVFAILFLHRKEKRILFSLFGISLGLGFLYGGPLLGSFLIILLFIANWFLIPDGKTTNTGLVGWLVYCVSAFIMVLYCFFNLQVTYSIPGFIITLIAGASLIFMHSCIAEIRNRNRMHDIFQPLQLIITRSDKGGKPLYVYFFILFAVLIPLGNIAPAGSYESINTPSPLPVSITPRTVNDWLYWESVWKQTTSLPNLAAYMAHTAYQEHMFDGWTYRFPAMDESIVSTVFTLDAEKKLTEKEQTIFTFTSGWIDRILSELPPLEQMMLAQMPSQGVGYRPVNVLVKQVPEGKVSPSWIMSVSFAFLGLSLLLFIGERFFRRRVIALN